MSKGILEFKLPEETEEFETAQKAGRYEGGLDRIDNFLRNKIKYDEGISDDVLTLCVEIRRMIGEVRSNDE